MSDPEPVRARGPIVLAVALVLAGAVAGVVGQGRHAQAAREGLTPVVDEDAGPPDLFLVTLGNVRADRLPFYRYDRMTVPWLTKVSRRSQVFGAASATSSWTLPSVASMMTGLLPSQHGLEELPQVRDGELDLTTLSERATTLAERLSAEGYATYAVVASPLLLGETGLERGFDRYVSLGYTRAARVQIAIERIAADVRKRETPVFVWIHYGDAHPPHAVGSPIVSSWASAPEGDEPAEELQRYARASLPELLRMPELRAPGEALDRLGALYDSELRAVDEHVQLLWGDLGITDDDVVVIAGDHGTELREHGELGAGRNLHETSVRVPLMLSWPAVWTEPTRFMSRVSLVDLVPTLADLAGARIPEGELPARSLVPLIDGGEEHRDVPVVAELLRADGVRCRAVYEGVGNKVISGAAGEAAFYDLTADPGELTDRAGEQKKWVRAIEKAGDDWTGKLKGTVPYVQTVPAAPGLAAQIEALGYALPPASACP